MLEKREFEKNEFLWRLSTAVAVVSGLFSFIVFVLMLLNYLQVRQADPVNHQLITQMRVEYAASPEKNELLSERIRVLELLNRKAYFTSQYHLRTGAMLLLVGVTIFMIALKYSIRWQRATPTLEEVPTADLEFLSYAKSRQLIMWAGVGMLAVGIAAALLTESAVLNDPALVAAASATTQPDDATAVSTVAAETPGAAPAAAVAVNAPAWETIQQNWPSFRGPGSAGTAHFTNAPTDFDVAAGKGVRWKTEIALPGANSPVIWDKKLFLSGADEATRKIFCYNVEDGKLIWEQAIEALAPGAKPPKVTEETGFAAPSMVAHGGQVFAIFADGDLVSYDMDGKRIWGVNLGLPENHYGHSSSLLAFDKFLYVQLDQSKNPKLMALDIASGKEVWKADRKTISWASPTLAQTPFGPQLILNSETTVDSYDPITGTALWSQECLSGEVAPSPAYSNGIVLAANEYAVATAIQLEKSDAGITPKVLWEFDELLPEVSSPVGDGERFYFGTAAGIFVCLEAKTGNKLWEAEFDEGFYSSPVLVGDRIYILDKHGDMHIVQASSTYTLIATRSIGEETFATPAFMDGRIYVRTNKNLYCIEQPNA